MNLDNDLRQAMRRVPAPEGFAERVMARLNEPRRDSHPARWRAIAATLLLGAIIGGWGVHETLERRRGERARDQVLLALRIAGTQVARAQRAAHQALMKP